MRLFLKLIVPLLAFSACSKDGLSGNQAATGPDDGVYHGMIVLGERLENPYRTETVRQAYTSLYPTKSREDISTTDLYVRFLPGNEDEFKVLKDSGIELLDHPVDYEILKEGDWYHDPSVGDGNITWQYGVVPVGFSFPEGIRYEIIAECFLHENSAATKSASDVDWEAVEAEAYSITGNSSMLAPSTRGGRGNPSGRITIVDEDANGGKAFGLAGIRVSCNVFVKFAHTYTDRDGYYTMPKKFSSSPRYRLVFQNEKGFSIGFNMVLVPASVSTLGKASADGINYTVSRQSDQKLYKRSVVNNAAYDYYMRCSSDDMDLPLPPGDLRIWLFHNLRTSSAVMLHHGTVTDKVKFGNYLDIFASVLRYFAPDITIGTKDHDDYKSLYDSVCHELAHASHFTSVGTGYWTDYIAYIVDSFLSSGGETYGTGTGTANAGHCEVGEMWAYHVESMMHKERYGGTVPSYGTSYWFYPQIFRYLEERGLTRSEIFSALDSSVSGRDMLMERLVSLYPQHSRMIEQVFYRYR